jgi:hypothetical protein
LPSKPDAKKLPCLACLVLGVFFWGTHHAGFEIAPDRIPSEICEGTGYLGKAFLLERSYSALKFDG